MIEVIHDYLSSLMKKYNFTQQSRIEEINEVINGSYKISNTVISNKIKINGQAILGEDVSVKEKIVINGSLISTKADFNSDLVVNGSASLVDTKVKGHSFFSGNLVAKNSVFSNTINLLVSKSEFEHCQVNTLTIQALPVNIVQRIKLSNATTVTGNILFQSGMGEIYVDATSVIQGNIEGGTLIKE